MLFKRKSGFRKALDILTVVVDLLDRRGPPRKDSSNKLVSRAGWIVLGVPLIWTNREPIRKAAGAVLKQTQERVSLARQVMAGGEIPASETKPEEKKEAA